MSAPTPHLEAREGEIADAVLLPGDPLRAQFIAEELLEGASCYNRVRNALGFTGTWQGRRVSVQGTGMGMPSIGIYATELFRFYGVGTAIRVGSCGSIQPRVGLRDVVIALSAHTNSSMNERRFRGVDFAPTASFDLVATAARLAGERGLAAHVGTIFSSDLFYDDDTDVFDLLARHGTLAVEMEAAALYTIAAAHGGKALCIATVSDHIPTGELLSSEERQNGFAAMAALALDTVVAAG
ncbi:MAG: purine-nucleoside phosphorylase [Acidimicrobiia bacterium]|nr:purine-nucleoside phosphorylase [Acidimicrobiia bacterium]